MEMKKKKLSEKEIIEGINKYGKLEFFRRQKLISEEIFKMMSKGEANAKLKNEIEHKLRELEEGIPFLEKLIKIAAYEEKGTMLTRCTCCGNWAWLSGYNETPFGVGMSFEFRGWVFRNSPHPTEESRKLDELIDYALDVYRGVTKATTDPYEAAVWNSLRPQIRSTFKKLLPILKQFEQILHEYTGDLPGIYGETLNIENCSAKYYKFRYKIGLQELLSQKDKIIR